MSIDNKISKLMLQCNLGQVIERPIRVSGGLSHRMYKVVTDKGIYAVKELNKGIMKRKDAYFLKNIVKNGYFVGNFFGLNDS